MTIREEMVIQTIVRILLESEKRNAESNRLAASIDQTQPIFGSNQFEQKCNKACPDAGLCQLSSIFTAKS
jgi:hypothetical protein